MKKVVNLSKDQKILSFGFRLPDFNQGETYHIFQPHTLNLGIQVRLLYDEKLVFLGIFKVVSFLLFSLVNDV